MKFGARIGAILLLLSTINCVSGDEQAVDVVKKTTSSVLDRVRTEKEVLRADPAKMYALVSEVIFPHFDFEIMSKWVLGGNWGEAQEELRAEFVSQYRKLLVRTYASALLEFSDQEIAYPDNADTGNVNTAVVRQNISGSGGTNLPVVYRLHNKTGKWLVFDVSVDGVSLVKTYRASFAAIIKQEGLEGLISSLESKNAQFGE
jgi:phospholipid transport system substrate-binding protein